jgi:tryptophan synthase beta chain
MLQMEMAGDYPDVIVGCTGGGSNFAGIAFPFLGKKLRGEKDVRVVAVEPSACPTLTKGEFAYDFGDTAHLTPLVKMHTLGSTFVPPGFHSGGLRYHGAAGIQLAKAEGILPAPEATHAVVGAIREAERCREEGKEETILFNLCGHGHFDMQAYMDYNAGKLQDYEYPQEEIAMALAGLPSFGNA